MESVPERKNHNWTIYVVASVYLILTFLWRFFTPAHEYPGRSATYLDIALDLLVLGSVIGMRVRIFEAMDEDDSRQTLGKTLFWFALSAGLGMLAIRFLGGDAQWWTGHRVYYLSPR